MRKVIPFLLCMLLTATCFCQASRSEWKKLKPIVVKPAKDSVKVVGNDAIASPVISNVDTTAGFSDSTAFLSVRHMTTLKKALQWVVTSKDFNDAPPVDRYLMIEQFINELDNRAYREWVLKTLPKK